MLATLLLITASQTVFPLSPLLSLSPWLGFIPSMVSTFPLLLPYTRVYIFMPRISFCE